MKMVTIYDMWQKEGDMYRHYWSTDCENWIYIEELLKEDFPFVYIEGTE